MDAKKLPHQLLTMFQQLELALEAASTVPEPKPAKVCKGCGELKPAAEYYTNGASCKLCDRARKKRELIARKAASAARLAKESED